MGRIPYALYTHLKLNVAPKNIPSQKESSLPTMIFQGLCWTSGGYINIVQLFGGVFFSTCFNLLTQSQYLETRNHQMVPPARHWNVAWISSVPEARGWSMATRQRLRMVWQIIRIWKTNMKSEGNDFHITSSEAHFQLLFSLVWGQ